MKNYTNQLKWKSPSATQYAEHVRLDSSLNATRRRFYGKGSHRRASLVGARIMKLNFASGVNISVNLSHPSSHDLHIDGGLCAENLGPEANADEGGGIEEDESLVNAFSRCCQSRLESNFDSPLLQNAEGGR